MTATITVEAHVAAPPEAAWRAFTAPDAITAWNFASPDWCCPKAEVELRVGGTHRARMEARDGSVGFDFEGTYEEVDAPRALTLRIADGRRARTTFEAQAGGTRVRTVFDPETIHPVDMQRAGWQSILDNYASYVARTAS